MVDIFYRKYCRWYNCYYENNVKINFNPSLKTTKNIIWIKGKQILFPMKSMKPLGEFDYIDIDAIDNKFNIISNPKRHNIDTAPSRATRKVFATSTLFSMVRPYLRNIAYVGEKYKDCIASTGFYVCTPMPFINEQYLFLLLTSDYVVNSLNYYMKGDNSPSINGSDIEEFYFPIPSLNYQKKVVKELNLIFPKLKRIREDMSSLYSYVNNAKQKILEYYFGENSCYKSYYQHEKDELQNICKKITKGSTPTTYGFDFLDNGISFIKVENVKNHHIDNESITCYISDDANEFQKRSQLKENDVLFSIAGTIGRTCIVTKENLPANTNQAFAIISEYEKIKPKYLLYFLEYSKLSIDSHGGGMMNATLGGLKTLNIWYPISKNIQEKIIYKIENSFELLNTIIS